jgi:hypothetical protein
VKRTAGMVTARSTLFSVVRFTDFISDPCHPSDESLGYYQSSAKRGLGRNTFCAKLRGGNQQPKG